MRILFFLMLILISACSGTKKTKNVNAQIIASDFVSLQRTPCYGTCPAYKVIIYGDGRVVYEGVRFVDSLGTFNGSMNANEAQKLFQKIETYDWISFPDAYPIDNYDFPQFFIEYNTAETSRKIKANSLASQDLIDLAKLIDDLLLTVKLEAAVE